jgi:hypothetical protein
MTIISIDKYTQGFEIANLLGEWINVNVRTDFIYALRLYFEDNQLKLNILWSNPEQDKDPSSLIARAFSTDQGHQASGFYVYQENRDLVIAANGKSGVLVIQSYQQSATGDRSANQLTREFYCRKSRADPDIKNQDLRVDFRAHRADQNSHVLNGFENLLGDWRNTHLATEWINAFSIHKTKSGWIMQAASPNDACRWSATPLIPYFFDQEELGFIAHSRSKDTDSLFSAYSNKGLIVMTAFHTVRQKNQAKKVFCREFYSKECVVNQSAPAVLG